MMDLADAQAARTRIAAHMRKTPLVRAWPTRTSPAGDASLYLKLECLQVTGSFKARGAVNRLLTLGPEQVARGLVTASGGNHGMGVAYAGWLARTSATVYLPRSTPRAKIDKLTSWGATVIVEGDVWDDANAAALRAAERDGLTYVHPFADPAVIAGQATVALEVLDDLLDVDIIIAGVGGGGLVGGMGVAAKALSPRTRVIGVEPEGAATLYESLRAGRLVELPEITTRAGTLAPRLSAPINLEIFQHCVDDVVLVSDDELAAGARWLWDEMNVAAELSGAAGIAALQAGKIRPGADETVCVVVSGAGTDGLG